jgi:hypothetical protein
LYPPVAKRQNQDLEFAIVKVPDRHDVGQPLSRSTKRQPPVERPNRVRPTTSGQRPSATNLRLSYASTRITTRRFWARPSRVLFGATGFPSP